MRRHYWFFIATALLLAVSLFAAVPNGGKERMRNMPIIGGAYDGPASVGVAPSRPGPVSTLDEPIGIVRQCGTTYYDYQHNGTAGKMVGVDDQGFVHMVWMKGLTATPGGPRQVNYQVWNPANDSMFFPGGGQDPTGQRIDASTRSGYVCQFLNRGGWSFPAWHETNPSPLGNHSAAAVDYSPRWGAFSSTQPAVHYSGGTAMEYVWPKIAVGPDSIVHMVTAWAAPAAGDSQPVFYSRGHVTYDESGNGQQIVWDLFGENNSGYQCFDTVKVIAQYIVADPNSHRVARLWAKCRDPWGGTVTQYNNDLYMQMSEDAGLNWGPRVNITNFADPDLDCASGDTLVCDRDTQRVYEDCNALFDMDGNLHVVFTTSAYYSLEGLINTWFSDVWHWSDHYNEVSIVHHGWFDSTYWTQAPGAWQREAQRPSLCLDETNGNLYCSVWVYDNQDVSEGGYPQGEAYISMSRNCGRTWSMAKDVTNTHPTAPGTPTPAGQCQSERDITIADRVSYRAGVGYVTIGYVLDLDAGGIAQSEGVATNNPVIIQQVPVDSIPALPLNGWNVWLLHADSSGMPGRETPLTDPEGVDVCPFTGVTPTHETLRPESFKLYQNYPNPFNPTTNIQFDLVRNAQVTLKVFNVLGEEVATLFDNKLMSAGTQTANFDASALASGVYLYRLTVANHTQTLKMVLMK